MSSTNNKSKKSANKTLSNVAHIEHLHQTQQANDTKFMSSIEAGCTTNVLVDSTSKVGHDEIVLQSALVDVCDIQEKRVGCVLFDGGSQQTYLTDALHASLGLQCIRKESLILKRWGY